MNARKMVRLMMLLLILPALLLNISCAGEKKETDAVSAEAESGGDRAEDSLSEEETDALLQVARSTPFGKYPELVRYTLGKMVDPGTVIPDGDDYEVNNYTLYLRELLNVANVNVLIEQNPYYDERLGNRIVEDDLPDIFMVQGEEMLRRLVASDQIEDLTEVYHSCASERIREMYESYGSGLLASASFDGRLMAFPDTEVHNGQSLLWLRHDWMEDLGLADPETIEEAMEIVRVFQEQNPGNAPDGNVGLVFSPEIMENPNACFNLQPILDSFGAFPGKWFVRDGEVVYGTVSEEMRQSLIYLHELYEEGILDPNFMLRTTKNLPDLLKDGSSGAFFGWWWAPNDPLMAIYSPEAAWKPYAFGSQDGTATTSLMSSSHKYIVARKGFEYPEIIPKVLSAIYDYARYDGKEEAGLVAEYLMKNVGAAMTPFGINVDYEDAVHRSTLNIRRAMRGEMTYQDMTVLEQGYYDAVTAYLDDPEHAENWQWAAYASRIIAPEELDRYRIRYVNEQDTYRFASLTDERLKKIAVASFIRIIDGEADISDFDEFCRSWEESGGKELMERAQEILRQDGQ